MEAGGMGQIPLSTAFCSIQDLSGLDNPQHMGRTISSMESTNSNAKIILKHPHRYIQK